MRNELSHELQAYEPRFYPATSLPAQS
jgi:hypothetical protein